MQVRFMIINDHKSVYDIYWERELRERSEARELCLRLAERAAGEFEVGESEAETIELGVVGVTLTGGVP
jgi:hypothetical protein